MFDFVAGNGKRNMWNSNKPSNGGEQRVQQSMRFNNSYTNSNRSEGFQRNPRNGGFGAVNYQSGYGNGSNYAQGSYGSQPGRNYGEFQGKYQCCYC